MWLSPLVLVLALPVADGAGGGQNTSIDQDRAKTLYVRSLTVTEGVTPDVGQLLDDRIAFLVGRFRNLRTISDDDVKTLLDVEAEKQVMGCSDDSSCLAEIAEALGADLVLSGRLGRLADRISLTLSLLDSSDAISVARVNVDEARVEDIIAALPDHITELMKVPMQDHGVLAPLVPEPTFSWIGFSTTAALFACGCVHLPLAGLADFGLWNLGFNNTDGRFTPLDFAGPSLLVVGATLAVIGLGLAPFIWWTTPDEEELLAAELRAREDALRIPKQSAPPSEPVPDENASPDSSGSTPDLDATEGEKARDAPPPIGGALLQGSMRW